MHKTMFNTLSHKRSTNQNYTEIPSNPGQIGNHSENKQQEMLLTMWRKWNPHTLLVRM
jgi:hypothetical protein